MRPWIGNDIVDLAEPGVAGKERDLRFMSRVFTPAERARILAAAAPTLALWKTWTAKETAFKVASKVRKGLVFAHRAFEVAADSSDQHARVRFESLDIRVRWVSAPDYVHCLGHLVGHVADAARECRDRGLNAPRVLASIARNCQALAGELTAAEEASVYSAPSARARLLARRLLERWNVPGAELLRLWLATGWSPPFIAQSGQPVAGFDVSLSHDGRFVAAALAGPVGPSLDSSSHGMR